MDDKDLEARLASASVEDRITLLDNHAEHFFQKGDFQQAGKHFARAFELEKQANGRAYFLGQMGICQYNAGCDRDALKMLLKSARLFDPDQPGFMPDMYGFVHFHLGSLFEYHGKTAKSLEARRTCEQYVESQEKDTKWMLYAGMSRNYEALGKHDEAIRYSQKAIQVISDNDPELAYLYESMGTNYMTMGQFNEALKHFSKVVELDPNFERLDEIQLKMANCYHQLTNDQLAVEIYEKMLELREITGKRENLIWLYIRIAESYFKLQKFEKSLLMTLEGLRRQPRKPAERAELRSYLTNNYYELGRYREAVLEGEKTRQIAKRFHNDSVFHFRMALSYYRLGNKKEFESHRTLCRKMFPDDEWNKYLDKLGTSA